MAIEGGTGYGSIGSVSTYLFMLGKLHRRHDLIVMDQRGTGHRGPSTARRSRRGSRRTRRRRRPAAPAGRAASAYGTGAVADDMAAILRRLRVPEGGRYGDSYGTYAAQVSPSGTRRTGRWCRRRLRQRLRSLRGESSVALRRPRAQAPRGHDRASWGRSGRWHAGSPRTRSPGPGRTPTACGGTSGSGRSSSAAWSTTRRTLHRLPRPAGRACGAPPGRPGADAPPGRRGRRVQPSGGAPAPDSVGHYLAVRLP